MSPNDADGMANSVDPDQTAPLGPLRYLGLKPKQSNRVSVAINLPAMSSRLVTAGVITIVLKMTIITIHWVNAITNLSLTF